MISNCDLHVYVRDALDLPEDASNEALVDAVNTLYAQYRDLKDELGVPYWAYHNEVLAHIKDLASSRDRYDELVRALGISPESDHSEVLERIRDHIQTRRLARMEQDSTREVNGRLVDMLGAVVQALGLHDKADLNEVLARIRADRQALVRAGVLHVELCEALGLDPEASDQQVATEVRNLKNLLHSAETLRDVWQREAAHLQGIIDSVKEAFDD